ncbi:PREDICTED: uncharacterized protein LOC106806909 [Priapulus caudatus]|uniref:Uncharacterized protein LOC106806909 n=1 Tax=Priapulus caudatus TaxID=37621 RepID=A0ABM1DX84_PRICU|nr:PREDICTED: uncharacterized protein LOC106806909 [Priapulus caudatus]
MSVCSDCSLPVEFQSQRVITLNGEAFHANCFKCSSCSLSLLDGHGKQVAGTNQYNGRLFCEQHHAEIMLMLENGDFLHQLREFKNKALGFLAARRKSSTSLQFPTPNEACPGMPCPGHYHGVKPINGYWVECPYTARIQAYENRRTPLDLYSETGTFELMTHEQEIYGTYFYGVQHWNYFTADEDLGNLILSLKQESINGREQFRVMVRTSTYQIHGLVPAACVFANRYDREDVVRSLGKEIGVYPPLKLAGLPSTPEDLLKLDQVFIKSELKVGVVYMKEDQTTEEEIFDNSGGSPLFEEFLDLLGDKIKLQGFDRYRGGLDTLHNLTGTHSMYTFWRGIEVMFHVSTLLPHDKDDVQKLQRKRHIGNDIVCIVFLEGNDTDFSPACIKSHFLHTFIVVQASPNQRDKPSKYKVSIVSRDEVPGYGPYLNDMCEFDKGPMFREWLLTKTVNGERASYTAPKFARMQDRTRGQMLEDLMVSLHNHSNTGALPQPYRRGSWRPIGHMRSNFPLQDSVRDTFESFETLSNDFAAAFKRSELCDVTFIVGKNKVKLHAVRAILGVRSRVFKEMLYDNLKGIRSASLSSTSLKDSNMLQVPDPDDSYKNKSAPSSPVAKRAIFKFGNFSFKRRSDGSHEKLRRELKRMQSQQGVWEDTENESTHGSLKRNTSTDSKDNLDEYEVTEFDPDTFLILLNYFHTGTCSLTCSIIPRLLCAAEYYDLPDLLQACFHHAKQCVHLGVVAQMLNDLEECYWRYNSAMELVNMIIQFINNNAAEFLDNRHYLPLCEPFFTIIICRELRTVSEIEKFQSMLAWAKYYLRRQRHPKGRASEDLKTIMDRLSQDLKLHKISPNDLIKVVRPSMCIDADRIVAALTYLSNSDPHRSRCSSLSSEDSL